VSLNSYDKNIGDDHPTETNVLSRSTHEQTNSSSSESVGAGAEHSPNWNESPQTPDSHSPHITSESTLPLSLGAKQYCAAVRSEYWRGFVRALYTALRCGCPVTSSDFQRVLTVTESFVDEVLL
jgi:hypothetical protein